MAQLITCDGPDADPAVFVVTKVDDGETNGFCLPCTLDFCQAMLQAFDPGRLAPPPKPAPRKSRGKAAAAVADDQSGGEEGAAAQSEGSRTA